MQYAERAVAVFEGDLEQRIEKWSTHLPQQNGRLKINALCPVAWVLDAIREAIAYYNSRTDHELEGSGGSNTSRPAPTS